MTARILVIDDDPSMRHVIMTLLRTKDYQVQTASNVQYALKLIAQQQPDVVCCDLMMPEITGVDFLEYCRQSPELSLIPVIIVSASGEEMMVEKACAKGAFACLPKPFSKVQLFDLIESALESVTR